MHVITEEKKPVEADGSSCVGRSSQFASVETHGGARGKRGKNKKLVFEAAFSGTKESYHEVVYPLLVSLGAIPSM